MLIENILSIGGTIIPTNKSTLVLLLIGLYIIELVILSIKQTSECIITSTCTRSNGKCDLLIGHDRTNNHWILVFFLFIYLLFLTADDD